MVYSTVGCRRTGVRRSQPGWFLFFTTPANLVLIFQSAFESRKLARSVRTVRDDACRAGNAAEMFQTVVVESFWSQQCRQRSRLHSKRCLRVVKPFLTHFPAWPFFSKPFFSTRQYCTVTLNKSLKWKPPPPPPPPVIDGDRTRVVVLACSARSRGMGAANARLRVLLTPRDSCRHFVSKCSHCACSVSRERAVNARSYVKSPPPKKKKHMFYVSLGFNKQTFALGPYFRHTWTHVEQDLFSLYVTVFTKATSALRAKFSSGVGGDNRTQAFVVNAA